MHAFGSDINFHHTALAKSLANETRPLVMSMAFARHGGLVKHKFLEYLVNLLLVSSPIGEVCHDEVGNFYFVSYLRLYVCISFSHVTERV